MKQVATRVAVFAMVIITLFVVLHDIKNNITIENQNRQAEVTQMEKPQDLVVTETEED